MADAKHPIRNSVLSTLIAAALAALIVYLIPGGWAWIFEKGQSVISATSKWLGSSLSVPAWLIVILSLLALAAIIAIGIVVYALWSKSSGGTEAFTEAEFFGIKWRWRYGQTGIYNIRSFCPKCDLQVYCQHTSPRWPIGWVVYRCDAGNWESQSFEMTQAQMEDRVEREIHRQLRRKAE